jgi:hypothetical protein
VERVTHQGMVIYVKAVQELFGAHEERFGLVCGEEGWHSKISVPGIVFLEILIRMDLCSPVFVELGLA